MAAVTMGEQNKDGSHPSYASAVKGNKSNSELDISNYKLDLSTLEINDIQLPLKQTQVKESRPAVIFSPIEIQRSGSPLQYALVAKFSKGRPKIEIIRDHIIKNWGLSEIPIISLIDYRHVLIKTRNAKDFTKVWTQNNHEMEGALFRIFKWTIDFNLKKESHVAPVWIRLPLLPLNFCILSYLKAITQSFGKFLDTDLATLTHARPAYARVCVELDLLNEREDLIWIGSSYEEGFWQRIEYEKLPKYCDRCWLQGHSPVECRKNKQLPNDQYDNKEVRMQTRGKEGYNQYFEQNFQRNTKQGQNMGKKDVVRQEYIAKKPEIIKTAGDCSKANKFFRKVNGKLVEVDSDEEMETQTMMEPEKETIEPHEFTKVPENEEIQMGEIWPEKNTQEEEVAEHTVRQNAQVDIISMVDKNDKPSAPEVGSAVSEESKTEKNRKKKEKKKERSKKKAEEEASKVQSKNYVPFNNTLEDLMGEYNLDSSYFTENENYSSDDYGTQSDFGAKCNPKTQKHAMVTRGHRVKTKW